MEYDLEELLDQFIHGWYETVEYQRRTQGELEQHVEARWQESLLIQLEQLSWHLKATGSEPSSGAKPKSRPPGDLNALDMYDAAVIAVRAAQVALEGAEEDGMGSSVRKLRKMRRSARLMLGYDAPTMVIADTVCHTCGGSLTVTVDASTSVRCVGSEETDPCGTEYARHTWISLLDGQSR